MITDHYEKRDGTLPTMTTFLSLIEVPHRT